MDELVNFFGNIKGPFVIWEKEWGIINSDMYC